MLLHAMPTKPYAGSIFKKSRGPVFDENRRNFAKSVLAILVSDKGSEAYGQGVLDINECHVVCTSMQCDCVDQYTLLINLADFRL